MAKGETENVSRGAESTGKQRQKVSRQTVHSPINQQDMSDGQDNDHPHLINRHFSQDDQKRDDPSSSSHDTRPFSPTRSPASISPLGDQMSDVTTRADDRWARLTLLLWSQRDEEWRERVKSGKMAGTIESLTCSHPASARQKEAFTPFSNTFQLGEAIQDSPKQVRIQERALALLEVAMWVALTQHQTGREMVSFVAGLEREILATVDMCALGMTDEDERSHCRTTTVMTNDSVVADAFRPYRCARDHKHVPFAGCRRSRRAQEHPRQFCELLVKAVKASLLPRDRREPSQLMTLSVRNDDEQDEDSGLDEDEASTDNQHPTEAQIKMVDQYHRHLGYPSRREFLKVLRAVHAKLAVLEYVRREYRCADCDAHSKPPYHSSGCVFHSIARTVPAGFEHHLPWHEIPSRCPHATRRDPHGRSSVVHRR